MKTKLFWWAPTKSAQLALPELKSNPGLWLRLAAQNGRLAKNFGDELSPLIVEAATGKKVEWAPPSKADVVAVGSVLDLYAHSGSGAAVWGSGLRKSPAEQESIRIRLAVGPVLGLRGPRTAKALGLSDVDTAYGDPGILAHILVGPRMKKMRRKVIFIGHFRTWGSKAGRRMLRDIADEGLQVLAPTDPPRSIIEAVRDSDFVFSSSLHGLILAHTFGIPAQLVSLPGDRPLEPDFKYQDYAESVSAPSEKIDMRQVLVGKNYSYLREALEAQAPVIKARTGVLGERLLGAAASL